MAYSLVRYPGNGSQTNFTFSFPYIDQSHVKVRIDGVLTTAFTFLTSSVIQFLTAPAAGSIIEIRRETPKDNPIVNFTDGSVLLERDLDLLAAFDLYISQEAYDLASEVLSTDSTGRWDGKGKRLGNLATAVNSDEAVNKGQLDYEYPLVSTVASNITNVNIVGSDLGVATSLPVDLGSVADAADESSPPASSKIVIVADNIAAVVEAADNMAAIQSADDNAIAAANSASSAAASATSAATSATSASSSKTSAETAATSAASSATTAQSAATTATTKASESAASAASSATSETNAASSAASAASSAALASSSATSASSSASSAASSASSAAASATQAASYIPSVSGNTGKFLTNDGTSPSWTDTFDFGALS